jgi:hypothetical protein
MIQSKCFEWKLGNGSRGIVGMFSISDLSCTEAELQIFAGFQIADL